MLESTSNSKQPVEHIDVPKYIGVASIKVMAINPDNAKLRALGWQIPEDASEPEYVVTRTDDAGVTTQSTRIRFMCQIQDFQDKPIVPLDFWIQQNPWLNKDRSKCQVIDQFGHTAWATKEELSKGEIPMYSSGRANIDLPYRPAHRGEEELVKFLMRLLCCTPYEVYNSSTMRFEKSKNPGKLTIDDWKALSQGNTREIAGYVATRPDNCVKVVLGVRHTDDNKTYQTFIDDCFIGNGATPSGGSYTSATKAIDRLMEDGYHANCQFSAEPVVLYTLTPTNVEAAPVEFSGAADTDDVFENGSSSDLEDMPF